MFILYFAFEKRRILRLFCVLHLSNAEFCVCSVFYYNTAFLLDESVKKSYKECRKETLAEETVWPTI